MNSSESESNTDTEDGREAQSRVAQGRGGHGRGKQGRRRPDRGRERKVMGGKV